MADGSGVHFPVHMIGERRAVDVARENGISGSQFRKRVSMGWSVSDAATRTKAYRGSPPHTIGERRAVDLAAQNGISGEQFRNRLKCGWSVEDAATKPLMTYAKRNLARGVHMIGDRRAVEVARENGISGELFRHRLGAGWTVTQAVTVPMGKRFARSKRKEELQIVEAFGLSETIERWSETSGIPKAELIARLAAGWHGERIVTEPHNPGFVIWDRSEGKPYLPKIWQDENEAWEELTELLRPYPPVHSWRRKLTVQKSDRSSVLDSAVKEIQDPGHG